MAIHQIERPDDYLRFMQETPGEVEALFRELLIGVTSFFRDPEAFAALQTKVDPRLFAGKPAGGLIRVWVSGCSTGEEAYSIAILIQEHLETLKQPFKVQIFATDIDDHAIDQARNGVYPRQYRGRRLPRTAGALLRPGSRGQRLSHPQVHPRPAWSSPSRT